MIHNANLILLLNDLQCNFDFQNNTNNYPSLIDLQGHEYPI